MPCPSTLCPIALLHQSLYPARQPHLSSIRNLPDSFTRICTLYIMLFLALCLSLSLCNSPKTLIKIYANFSLIKIYRRLSAFLLFSIAMLDFRKFILSTFFFVAQISLQMLTMCNLYSLA
jgi:hypothetical protein